jgi:hypothetical protein
MAWIEFHATRIKRLKKFSDFRKSVGWSVHEALGFLGDWWGQTVDVCETGDVTGWTSEYLSELTGIRPQVSPQVWDELVKNGWIDKADGGRLLIHDWPDWVGRYLRGKYPENRAKLVEIWSIHGRVYGEKKIADKLPTCNVSEPDTTLPNPTKHNLTNARDGARKAFKKPTPSEVTEYAKSIGFTLNGQYFCDSYEKKGWMIGRSPVKSWKACVKTWKHNDYGRGGFGAKPSGRTFDNERRDAPAL